VKLTTAGILLGLVLAAPVMAMDVKSSTEVVGLETKDRITIRYWKPGSLDNAVVNVWNAHDDDYHVHDHHEGSDMGVCMAPSQLRAVAKRLDNLADQLKVPK
jgi:hypothetical protein